MQPLHAITSEHAFISEMCVSTVLLVAHSQLLTILYDKHLADWSLGTRLSACSSTTFNFTFNYTARAFWLYMMYM